MTSEQYKQFLQELALRHFRVDKLQKEGQDKELQSALKELSSLSRLIRIARDNPDEVRINDILKRLHDAPIDPVFKAMDESGIMEALEQEPEAIFGNLQRSAIPDEDVELLRAAGVQNPEVEIAITIQYSQRHLANVRTNPSQMAYDAANIVRKTEEDIYKAKPEDRKKRKLFNGIGKILAGTVTGAGNVLLACGTIVAPNPATAYGAIGSSALAIGSVCQGIGDLRGE